MYTHQPEVPQKNNLFCFLGPYNYEVGLTLKMTGRTDLLWVFYDMHTPQTTGSAQKMSFSGYIFNFKNFHFTKTIHDIKLVNLSE